MCICVLGNIIYYPIKVPGVLHNIHMPKTYKKGYNNNNIKLSSYLFIFLMLENECWKEEGGWILLGNSEEKQCWIQWLRLH